MSSRIARSQLLSLAFVSFILFYVNQSASTVNNTLKKLEAESPITIEAPPPCTPMNPHLLAMDAFEDAFEDDNNTVQLLENQIRKMEFELMHRDAIIDVMKESMHEKDSEIERLKALLDNALLKESRQITTVIRVKSAPDPELPVTMQDAISQAQQVATSRLQTFDHPLPKTKHCVDPQYWKTALCNKFDTANGCPYGSRCLFAHGEIELRSRSVPSAGTI